MFLATYNTNSKNSSKPPSQDPNRPKPKHNGPKKKPGGQNGHSGSHLPMFEPDEIIILKIDEKDLPLGVKLEDLIKQEPEIRQIVDVEINPIVVEYQAEIYKDQYGTIYRAKFPHEVRAQVQYGAQIAAYVVYLIVYQMVPYERAKDLIHEVFGVSISTGTMANMVKEAYLSLEDFETLVKQNLLSSPFLCCDETGINVAGKNHWLHSASNAHWVLFCVDEKRGQEAMDRMNILPFYNGIIVHDHWKPYFKYEDLKHALCNAHHLRELTWVVEATGHKWAEKMIKFLTALNDEVDKKGGFLSLDEIVLKEKEYDEILALGDQECPELIKKNGETRAPPKGKERCLLLRLREKKEETLLFMKNVHVPFTNNMAERDIRMIKVHQKISGCFRKKETASYYCRIRSFFSTCRKQQKNILHELQSLFIEGKFSFGYIEEEAS